jgi:hypothetical protein
MRPSSRVRACLSAALVGAALCASPVFVSGAAAKSFYLAPAGKDSWLVIDPLTAESQPGGVVRRMWTVTVQRSIVDGDPPQPGYVRTQTDYDCVHRQVRWRTFSAYSRSGTLLVTRENPNPGWTDANSAADLFSALRVACEGVASSSVAAESIGRLVITLMAAWDPPEAPADGPKPLLPAPGAKGAKPGAKAAVPAKPPAAKPAAKPAPAKPKPT